MPGAKGRSIGIIVFLLALATFVVFLPTARNDFVNYDDGDYVTANSHVQSGLEWENVRWAFTTGHASNWHPLTWLSHMLDCQLFGQSAGMHHLVNVAFHAANTLLLFLVIRQITGAVARSAVVAAFFALHPLHVESVAWVSERKDVLSAFFFFLTIYAYSKYVEASSELPKNLNAAGQANEHGHASAKIFYFLTLILLVLGLMSKPMLVTLPFVLLLLDYWPLQRLRSSTALKLILEKVPFLILSLVSSWITFAVQQKGGAVSTSISVGARVANAIISYVRYLAKTVWPMDLSVLYPHPGYWPAWQVAAAAVFLLLVSTAAIIYGRERRYLIVGWLWFLGMLIPVIGLVQVGVQSMADRYSYVPLVGIFVMLVWGAGDWLERRKASVPEGANQVSRAKEAQAVAINVDSFPQPGPWALLTGFVLITCSVLTIRQLQVWRDSEHLFLNAVRVTHDNYLAYNNLGYFYSKAGRTVEAIENYRAALNIKPDYEDALNNMGYALAGQKKPAEAVPFYEAALRVRPKHTEVHNNFGNALSELGRIDDAIAHYRIVLDQKPDHADAHNNLGIALAMKGRLDEAIQHFHESLRYRPDDSGAHSNLGNALAVQRKFAEATVQYKESLRLKPDDPQAHNNLGNVLVEQGLLAEAIEHYQTALRLNAENPEAHFNFGIALARQGRRDEAVAHYKAALQLKPDYREAKQQLEAISTGNNR